VYDVLTNGAMSNTDSRLVERHGFKVDVVSPQGMSLRDKEENDLSESVDSHQAALDLAAAMPHVEFDLFLTFTCNQQLHPGVKHLHKFKESMEWNGFIPGYLRMSLREKEEIKRSYELAYGAILGRVWYEVRRIFLRYLTFSKTSVFRRVKKSFWRDEYQDCSGNLCHIHGLVALDKEDLSDEDFLEFICNLQKCNLAEIFETNNLQKYVDLGVFSSIWDYTDKLKTASKVLPHTCSPRCLMRVAHEGKPTDQFRCRVPHPLRYRVDPTRHEFRPLKFEFSKECLQILEECGIYDPNPETHGQDLNYWRGGAYQKDGYPKGSFNDKMFCPRRHYGPCNPNATENMSPVNPVLFAATESMQNIQVVRNTNGVARYVVKYVVKKDEGNRITLGADFHSGARMNADEKFLHNTKITRSRINEEKALEKSKNRKRPSGRGIAHPDMQGRVLGHSDVVTDLIFVRVQTLSFEQRKSTKFRLTRGGALIISDVNSTESDCASVRREKNFTPERNITESQSLLYRNNGSDSSVSYDMVTQFGLRPVEFLQVFRSLGKYFRWFYVNKEPMLKADMVECLHVEIARCFWVDCLGRQVRLRRGAFQEVRMHVQSMDGVDLLHHHSQELIKLVLRLTSDGIAHQNDAFIHEDGDKGLPIPVYSSVTPRSPVGFLLHVMLVCGNFESELDFRTAPSMRESLIAANLIGDKMDTESLRAYSRQLIQLVIKDILPGTPISLRRLDEYIVSAKNVFDRVLLSNDIPVTDIPPCLLTELMCRKDDAIKNYWITFTREQLRSIFMTISEMEAMPSMDSIAECSRAKPVEWCMSPVKSYVQSETQGDISYAEQHQAVTIGVRTIDKYLLQLGPGAATYTKNFLIHGVPGSGKSYVTKWLHLYALSRGLRVFPTAVMGIRANSIGGEHMHKFFCIQTKNKGNVYRIAELAIEKLHHKCNVLNLHAILTMDILLYDEFGQLSAELLKILDIIFRKIRDSNTSFGGVLIIANMDASQFGPIDGLPILLSSHVLTEFVIITLTESVRAQVIQTSARYRIYPV
jgi:PIF1 helicase.